MKKSAIAMALGVAFSQYSIAQEAPAADDSKLQRVTITGSSIKRTEAEAAGSVQVLTREDIARTGQTTVLGILNSSSAISTDISSASSSSGSFATGSSGVGMRGLGKVATLVLVNGQRISEYGLADNAQQNFTNLDAIPASAIERVEILKDGASAIYGSDAIAGVINIILLKDFEGAKLTGSYKESEKFKDQRNRSISGIIGWGDVDTNGFNTYLTYEGYKSDGYSTGDLQSNYPDWHRLTPGRSTWDAPSVYSPTGNLYLNANNYVAAPGCPADAIDPKDKLCKYNILPVTGLTTNAKRYALASNTHFRIGKSIDANLEITNAAASNDYIVAPFAVQPTTSSSTWYNAIDGKMVGPFFYPKLPVGHANNPYSTPVEFRARFADTGNGFNFNRTESEQSRVMLSLNGDLSGWDWKSAVGYMSSEATKATRAASAAGYTNAIVNGTYKFGGQNSYTLLDSMFPVRTTKGKSRTSFANATVSGEVAQLPAGPVNVAFGTDIRREHYEMSSSDNVLRGDLIGIAGLQVNDNMDHYALFTEATIPVIKRVELSAAVRADKSTNSDVHYSPKLGLRVNATDSLLLRATVSGGFRAPNIVETGNGLGRSSFATSISDPRRCSTASALNKLVQNAAGATSADKAQGNALQNADCLAGIPTFVSANKDLKPETSRSITVGAVWEPIKNWNVALDYFHIERKDEIGTRATSDILRGEASLPAGQLVRVDNTASDNLFYSLVNKYVPGNTLNFGGVGAIGLLYNPYVNSGKTRASGFDFDASGRFNTALGQVRLKLEGSYLWKYQQFSQTDNAYDTNMAGTYDLGAGRLNTKLRGSLKNGAFDHGMTINYASGYSNNSLSSPTYCVTNNVAAAYVDTCGRVGSNTTVDYNLTYSAIKNTTLALYIDNVLSKDAPVQWRDGYQPQFRRIGLTASYKFF
ncbi:TonB-dependent receptor plug domain-containing protein [Duganella levis]|uniref:TonB-dependent receptor n=1 Tax=Duganella levis TaxID=2692169 RepID=A0ABW9W0R5_9BURK|nr:TonB-dependent receptor [Duganella levis]MYN27503.1 TonB-dependent receptor [Duganella levis]